MGESSKDKTTLAYRSDVDGLRAVAVLLVLFCHLDYHLAKGGYIGVDVFFVISGYLISSVILTEMAAGKFSIAGFYERRIRRIFPALLAMLLGASLMAYRYLLPADLLAFARSELAALFSVSNFLFWSQSGYFDEVSAVNPMLHTWSLAVEEQFYILFPIFLVVVRRFCPKRLKAAVWTLTIVSLTVASIWVKFDSSSVFFLAPFRAWEFLIGTILSQRYLPSLKGPTQRNIASLAGIALILFAAAKYGPKTLFPGAAALAPCIGAALIIAAGETGTSLIGRALSWRPVVFIGLISYSLYLWHWPILVFQNTNSMLMERSVGDKQVKIVVIVLSILAAALSWLFIERPFRKGRFRPQRKTLLAISAVAVAVVAAVDCTMLAKGGLPSRFSPEALRVAGYSSFHPDSAWRQGTCFILQEGDSFDKFRPDICLRKDPTRRNILLAGDSLSAALYPGLTKAYPDVNFAQISIAGCPLMVSEQPVGTSPWSVCSKASAFLFGQYLQHQTYDTVILASSWLNDDMPEIGHTISWIRQRGMKVVLVGPPFMYDMGLPRLLVIALREHSNRALEQHWVPVRQQTDRTMAALSRDQWKVPYISAFDDLCVKQTSNATGSSGQQMVSVSDCPVFAAPGVPIYFDPSHFTIEGSVLYASRMRAKGQL
jgi:peptidoglycan/LPS O-acetylase OafA/YrhL